MNETMRNWVIDQLKAMGWYGAEIVSVGSKDYMTAVGVKTAVAYIADFGVNEGGFWISGDYQSEGRNALEPHMVTIPRDADEATVRTLVEKFANNADAVIAQTYAARLYQAPAQS